MGARGRTRKEVRPSIRPTAVVVREVRLSRPELVADDVERGSCRSRTRSPARATRLRSRGGRRRGRSRGSPAIPHAPLCRLHPGRDQRGVRVCTRTRWRSRSAARGAERTIRVVAAVDDLGGGAHGAALDDPGRCHRQTRRRQEPWPGDLPTSSQTPGETSRDFVRWPLSDRPWSAPSGNGAPLITTHEPALDHRQSSRVATTTCR